MIKSASGSKSDMPNVRKKCNCLQAEQQLDGGIVSKYCVAICCNSLHGGAFQWISFMHRDTFTHKKLFRISIWAHAENFIDFRLFTSASDHDFKTFSFLLFAASFDVIF